MNLSRTQLAKVIATHSFKTGVSKTLSKDVAKILLTTKKTGSLNSLMRDVERDWEGFGYIDVIARSAFPLSDRVKKDIEQLVKANYESVKHIKIIEVIDKSVVGGLVLEFSDKQLDLTIENKISKFKNYTVS